MTLEEELQLEDRKHVHALEQHGYRLSADLRSRALQALVVLNGGGLLAMSTVVHPIGAWTDIFIVAAASAFVVGAALATFSWGGASLMHDCSVIMHAAISVKRETSVDDLFERTDKAAFVFYLGSCCAFILGAVLLVGLATIGVNADHHVRTDQQNARNMAVGVRVSPASARPPNAHDESPRSGGLPGASGQAVIPQRRP